MKKKKKNNFDVVYNFIYKKRNVVNQPIDIEEI